MRFSTPLLGACCGLAMLLAGCSVSPNLAHLTAAVKSAAAPTVSSVTTPTSSSAPPQAVSTITVPAAASSTTNRSATSSTTSAPSATAATATSSVASSTATGSAVNAIKVVIQRANQEQAEAFAQQDPSIMHDTATTTYYRQLVQINQELAASGVTNISLVKLEWGAVTAQGTGGQATTYETWQTSFDDGTSSQSRDRNVYTLTLANGAWKIAADEQPDANPGQPAGTGVPSAPGVPSSPSIPSNPSSPTTPAIPLGKGQSHNWAGYAATGGTYTAVTGTWKVPQVDINGGEGSDATWVGIGGVESHDLIQAGTDATALGQGPVQYEAWIELLPNVSHTVPLTVSAGDSMTVSLAQQSDGKWLITLKDNTTGQQYQTTTEYQSSLSSAEWIEEAPSGGRHTLPLDDFGTVQFLSGTTLKNGKQVDIAQAGAQSITMINGYGQAIAVPSALGRDGASFSVKREESATPATSPAISPYGRRPRGARSGLPPADAVPGTLPLVPTS